MGEGATAETADAWIAAWEAEAAHTGVVPGTAAYWDAGCEWIQSNRRSGKPSSTSNRR